MIIDLGDIFVDSRFLIFSIEKHYENEPDENYELSGPFEYCLEINIIGTDSYSKVIYGYSIYFYRNVINEFYKEINSTKENKIISFDEIFDKLERKELE